MSSLWLRCGADLLPVHRPPEQGTAAAPEEEEHYCIVDLNFFPSFVSFASFGIAEH